MKKYLPTFEKGFTLIELMVVVTIIAFLSVIGIVAFSNAQAQARDGRRRADIDAIATAMEANRTGVPGSEAYPAYADNIFANNQRPCDPIDSNSATCTSTTTNVPTAGYIGASYAGTAGYGYQVSVVTTSPSSYIVCAKLEKGNGNTADAGVASPWVSGATSNYYCRKSQQ